MFDKFFIKNELDAKCEILRNLIQNQEACLRYERYIRAEAKYNRLMEAKNEQMVYRR